MYKSYQKEKTFDISVFKTLAQGSIKLDFQTLLREDAHKKSFFSGRTTKRGGRGRGKTPSTTKKNHTIFYLLKRNDQNLMNLQALGGGTLCVSSLRCKKKYFTYLYLHSMLQGLSNTFLRYKKTSVKWDE